MKLPILYIAGPFRAENAWEIEQNIRRAEAVALRVWRAGGVALCPHTNTRFFQGAAPDAVWLDGDLELLRRCDGLVLAAPPDSSLGVQAEVTLAEERGLFIFRAYDADEWDACRQWIREYRQGVAVV